MKKIRFQKMIRGLSNEKINTTMKSANWRIMKHFFNRNYFKSLHSENYKLENEILLECRKHKDLQNLNQSRKIPRNRQSMIKSDCNCGDKLCSHFFAPVPKREIEEKGGANMAAKG